MAQIKEQLQIDDLCGRLEKVEVNIEKVLTNHFPHLSADVGNLSALVTKHAEEDAVRWSEVSTNQVWIIKILTGVGAGVVTLGVGLILFFVTK